MARDCCHHCDTDGATRNGAYRRILFVALGINVFMFAVEIASGLRSGSVSLLADSLDFLGDSANYALSISVLGSSHTVRARASIVKAMTMGAFSIWILGSSIGSLRSGVIPSVPTMGWIACFALLANLVVAFLLFAYREGDSNMRSVWLCTRNDALGNAAVLCAALGVFGTGTNWPDLFVAATMAILAFTAALHVAKHARRELAIGM